MKPTGARTGPETADFPIVDLPPRDCRESARFNRTLGRSARAAPVPAPCVPRRVASPNALLILRNTRFRHHAINPGGPRSGLWPPPSRFAEWERAPTLRNTQHTGRILNGLRRLSELNLIHEKEIDD